MNAEPGEEIRIVFLLFFGFFMGISWSTFDVSATTLFLDTFDHDYLPLAFILSGLLGIGSSRLFVKLQKTVPFARLVNVFMVITYLVILVLFMLLQTDSVSISFLSDRRLIFLAFLFIGPSNGVMLLIFWGLFGRLFDGHQAKRLTKGTENGLILGAGLAFFAIAWILNHPQPIVLGPMQMAVDDLLVFILVSGLSLFSAQLIFFPLVSRYQFLNHLRDDLVYINANNNIRSLVKNGFVVHLAWFSVVSALTILFIDYFFLYSLAQVYTDRLELGQFLSLFSGIIVILTFLIQSFLSQIITTRLGNRFSLLILPVLLGILSLVLIGLSLFDYQISLDTGLLNANDQTATGVILIGLFFPVISSSKLITSVLRDSIEAPTFKFYFLPIETVLRRDIQPIIEGVIKKLGILVGGLLLIILIQFLPFDHLDPYHFLYFVLVIVFIGLWIYFTIKMHNLYERELKAFLDIKQSLIRTKVGGLTFAEKINLVLETFPGGKNLERMLSVLKILDPLAYKKAILNLLDSEDNQAQEIALLQTGDLCYLEGIALLEDKLDKAYLKNATLIHETYWKLRGAEERLHRLKYVQQLTYSKRNDERKFGASLTSYYSDEDDKAKLLNRLFRDPDDQVQYQAVISSAGTSNVDLHNNLIEKLNTPLFSNSAFTSILATGDKIFPTLESAFYLSGQKFKVQQRILQVYGQLGSAKGSGKVADQDAEKAIELLWKKLSYPDQNIIALAIEAISKCQVNVQDKDQADRIESKLEELCKILVWNISVSIALKEQRGSELLQRAIKAEIRSNYATAFRLLALLIDPQSVELIRKNLSSADPDEADFATELLGLILPERYAVKPWLKRLLSIDPDRKKLRRLKKLWPIKDMSSLEILYSIIQREYTWINRWTKVCALQILSEHPAARDYSDLFAANMVNPDPMIRETAAYALSRVDPEKYNSSRQRLDQQSVVGLTDNLPVNGGAKTGHLPRLKFEVVEFLSGVREFENISGLVLSEIAKITELMDFSEGQVVARYRSPRDLEYFLIYSGSLMLHIKDKPPVLFDSKSFLHPFDFSDTDGHALYLEAKTDCVLLKLNRANFNELLSFYEEIPASILAEEVASHFMEDKI